MTLGSGIHPNRTQLIAPTLVSNLRPGNEMISDCMNDVEESMLLTYFRCLWEHTCVCALSRMN